MMYFLISKNRDFAILGMYMIKALSFAVATVVAASASADGPVVTVHEVRPVSLPKPLNGLDMGQAVAEALQAAGCVVETVCRDAGCVERTPSSYVVSVDATYQAADLTCDGELSVRTGGDGASSLFRERLGNPVCPATTLVSEAKEAAALACQEVRKHVATRPPPPVAPRANVLSTDAREHGTSHRWIAPVITGSVGLVAAGVGAYFWAKDGDPASCAPGGAGSCQVYDSKRLGIPLVAAGSAVAVLSGAWLGLTLGRNRVAVAPTASGFIVAGRF